MPINSIINSIARGGIVVSVPTPEPVTNFSGTPLTGEIPLTVTFTDLSTNEPDSWLWDFGDGETSTSQNPTHEYTTVDSFTVTLTTENAGGEDDEIKTDYVTTSMTTPTGLTVDNILTTSMKLNWNAVAGADHYEVYLDDVLVDDTVTDEFYTFTGLTESTEYTLGVKAVDVSDNASTMATITQTTATPDEANVSNKTSDYEISADDSGTIFTNEGAGGEINLTLPTCAAGLYYTFVVKNSHKLDVLLGDSDKIINVGTGTEYTTGAYAQINGRSMTLIGIDDTYWVLSDQNGFTLN